MPVGGCTPHTGEWPVQSCCGDTVFWVHPTHRGMAGQAAAYAASQMGATPHTGGWQGPTRSDYAFGRRNPRTQGVANRSTKEPRLTGFHDARTESRRRLSTDPVGWSSSELIARHIG